MVQPLGATIASKSNFYHIVYDLIYHDKMLDKSL